MKKILAILIALSVSFSTVWSISAIEHQDNGNSIDKENIEVVPRSGGLVSTTYTLSNCSDRGEIWEYKYLTSAWAKASSYTVSKTVTIGSSTSVSIGINASVNEQLRVQTGFTYGTSVSNSASIGITLPADASRNSKLRFATKMKKYYVTVTVANKYYDTATGYRTTYTDYSGYVNIPIKNQTYMQVAYQ